VSKDPEAERRSCFVSGLLVGAAAAIAGVALVLVLSGEDIGGASLNEQARAVIAENYFQEVSDDELDEASIRGMVEVLKERFDDRFSHYFSPEEYTQFQKSLSPELSGIGVGIEPVKDGLRIATVYPRSPAEDEGLGVGDVITAVEGESIADRPTEVVTALIKGKPGTDVELSIDPAGRRPSEEVVIERARIELPAATGEIRRADETKVAYVRFTSFDQGAHGELRDEIQRLYREGAEGLLIDLRGNPGGRLEEARLSASLFVEDGEIVTTRGRADGTTVYEASGDAFEPRPTVVLVDGGSASASEILAGAFDVYDLATVVGETTFGKGSVQLPIPLPDGSALDLTIAEYLLADGTSIAGDGIKPDVKAVDDPDTRRDEGLDRALEVLGAKLAG
jgi:carboxyl-terminal processing protease